MTSHQIHAAQARLEAALPAALKRIRARPGAYAALWCGSASRGEGIEGSDLDFHVLVTGDERWRDSFVVEGVPVEVFHNPPRKVRAMFADNDGDTIHMFAQGKVVLAHPELASLMAEARQRLEAGRPAQPVSEFERFVVLESVMDTRAQVAQPMHPMLVMNGLMRHVIPLLYRSHRWWEVQEKFWLRDLGQRAPDVAADLREVLTASEPLLRQAAFERLALRLTGDFEYRDLSGERQPVP